MTTPPATLPGERTASPHLLENATGFTMALHMMGGDTCTKVEEFLRANGFAPVLVPFPVSVVLGESALAVCCSLGPGPGAPRGGIAREWRVVPLTVEPPIGLLRDIKAAGGTLLFGADKIQTMTEEVAA